MAGNIKTLFLIMWSELEGSRS